MAFEESCAVFLPFIEFLSQRKEALLDDPYKGDIETIRGVFREVCNDEPVKEKAKDQATFRDYLAEFNVVSGSALVFNSETDKQLIWIKVANISILKDRLKNSEPYSALDPQTVVNCEVSAEKGFDHDFARLNKMLARPTAMVKLGVKRAQLITTQKPFYEVCEVLDHSQTLANLCLNLKSIGLGFNELPSNAKIHKVISSCKSLLTKEVLACVRNKIHFLPLLTNNTDLYLGNCSYLDTCHKLKNCRYLHFYTLNPSQANVETSQQNPLLAIDYTIGECHDTMLRKELPAQWINCDVRYLPFSILGKFAAIISDPAWDIHMSLPYGTCKDSELLSLPMRELQDEGVLMLWVTGRSIEIGRRALEQWGYTVSDEMIWIKLNQLRKTIVTGRTGHWLNHSKEHLLVGVKGNPVWLNRKIDIDFIVSGTRETLRKPDELYGIVERLVGIHARKLEIFGRDNNIRPGWITIGNQLTGTSIYEEEVKQKYNRYQSASKKN
ncbi:MT-A70-domain-containing protein [Metschnikowia bicuspidata var. bicuspidata NRRL YB-4993]|uniref:mRNA m(6)A methyltransferase n=1 Tax=Metschnikowia bicuspidata var. bicuspidata NRRL YB-4993 TaxID=869754 RepID=A0A1A0HGL2_9ASCO|nr:MT-A70-domain-containing protein [Metschnikowia bicuspidata var. bicuspidata NRRL YB-4993]OBA23141.1 MT-A70-domain-containing protein [Metschnikowia bicuspidata var. bicuspidata NRRL YB-4993]